MNGELVKAADYHLHTGKLNTARGHAQDLPKLFPSLDCCVDPSEALGDSDGQAILICRQTASQGSRVTRIVSAGESPALYTLPRRAE